MNYRQIPLYHFLNYCNKSTLPKRILDCGAGGDMPPLGIFYEHGFDTVGIELSDTQLKLAQEFETQHNMNLWIQKGDMRQLPFPSNSFPFVYSYNSIFHMEKELVKESILQLRKVLAPNGLLFVNFLSVSDFRCGMGKHLGNNQYLQQEDGMDIVHSYYESAEADEYFKDMKLIQKEERNITRIFEGKYIKQGFIDYIVQK